MKNKSEKISRHCRRGPAIQGFYKGKTALLNRLDPESMSGMTTRNAFTLIELLVVVLIIGILAAVAVPQYQKATDKARFTQMLITARDIKSAQAVYYLANGVYSNNAEDLGVTIPEGISITWKTVCSGSVPASTYMRWDQLPDVLLIDAYDKQCAEAHYWEGGHTMCYALPSNDRANALCAAVSGKTKQTDCGQYCTYNL